MLVDVVLYKTKLSTTDTMVFDGDTAEEVRANQSAFFATLEKKTFTDKLSFNGRRSIRIKGNYWILNLDGYNYCTITYSNKTYFCFIDKFTYINDNCTQVDVTTDYIQTYLTEIKFSQLFIEQRNYKINDNSLLDIPYKNTYPVGAYNNVEQIYPISDSVLGEKYTPLIFFVLINTSAGSGVKFKDYVSTIPFNGGTETRLYELTSSTDIACAIFPALVSANDGRIINAGVQFAISGTSYSPIMQLKDFISKYNDSIIDIFCSDLLQNITHIDYPTIYLDGGRIETYVDGDKYTYFLISTSIVGGKPVDQTTIIKFDNSRKNALFRSPYYNIFIGRDGDSMSLINPFDLDTLETFGLKCEFIQTLLPPYNSVMKVKNTRRKYDSIYSFNPVIDNLVYEKSAWSQYKLTHSASVGDSLATKHSYDMEIAERNYQNQKNIAETKRKIGGVDAGLGGLGNLYGGLGAVLGGNPAGVGQFVSGITSTITGGVKTGLTYEQDLENATVAYENAKTTIAQESALLQIEYNNIKNSPSEVKNFYSGGSYIYTTSSQVKINILEPSNIEEIIKYHKRFGFETALQTEITDLEGLHDTNAQHFDYIRTMNASVISENIPKQSADIIAKIFDSGIYLWRNYEKLGEDYFSNYAGE